MPMRERNKMKISIGITLVNMVFLSVMGLLFWVAICLSTPFNILGIVAVLSLVVLFVIQEIRVLKRK